MQDEEMTAHNIERPDCGHIQTVNIRKHQSIADYNFRVVPALKEAIKEPCEQCAKAEAEKATQEKEKAKSTK